MPDQWVPLDVVANWGALAGISDEEGIRAAFRDATVEGLVVDPGDLAVVVEWFENTVVASIPRIGDAIDCLRAQLAAHRSAAT